MVEITAYAALIGFDEIRLRGIAHKNASMPGRSRAEPPENKELSEAQASGRGLEL